jgi:hypothetical protein
MSEEIKICRDCKHRVKRWWFGVDLCDRDASTVVSVNLVTGRNNTAGLFECWSERRDHKSYGSCGVSGKYFKPKL